MKRIFLFLGVIMLTSVTLFTSCTDDTTVDTPPTINFVTGAGFISEDETLTVNQIFNVKILAEANATSAAKIQSLKITRVFNLQSDDTTYSFNDETLSLIISFVAQPEPGLERIEFKVTDKDGQSATIDLQITTEAVSGGDIYSWTERVMGSWKNPIGSSFASINGNVYTLSQAFADQSIIDYMYWFAESTQSPTIGSPADTNAAKVFNTTEFKLVNWDIRNDTKFKTTTVSSAAFDDMNDATDIIAIATGADQTRLWNLAADQVIAFVTVTNKHGLIRVRSFISGSEGSITIDVKVEK